MENPCNNPPSEGPTRLNPYALSGAFLAHLARLGWINVKVTEKDGVQYHLTSQGLSGLSSEPYRFELTKLFHSGKNQDPT